MKSFKQFIGLAFVLALLVSVASLPALAQDCGSSCGASCDKSTAKKAADCGSTCQEKTDCCGTCGGTCQEKTDCCGTCGGTCQETAGFDMSAMMDCEICSRIMNDMELMTACSYNVNKIDTGLIFTLNLKQSELMPRLREFQKGDKALYDRLKAEPYAEAKDKLCPACAEYLAFTHHGLVDETIDTKTGSVVISQTSDPQLLTKVHAWGDQMHAAVAEYEAQEMAAMADASCCGTCGGHEHGHAHAHAHAAVGDSCPVTGKSSGACTATAKGDASCCGTCSDTKATCGSSCGDTCPVTGKSGGTCPSTANCESPCGIDMTDISAFASCHACSVMMENPEYMTMANCNVVSLDSGMVIYSEVQNPKDIKAYHAFNDKFMAKVNEIKRMPKAEAEKRMCPVCKALSDFADHGAVIDQKNTAHGVLTLVFSDKPAEIKKIQVLAKQLQTRNCDEAVHCEDTLSEMQ